jgi:hypothetical protein
MTVKELIRMLKEQPPDNEVRIWDADADDYMPVTGCIYEDGGPYVDLQSDED